jgi:hypothetical protein
MQRVSSEAKAADLHSSDLQAELRHQQEVSEERDAEIRRLQKVHCSASHVQRTFYGLHSTLPDKLNYRSYGWNKTC